MEINERKKLILETAIDLIGKNSLASFSMKQISDRAKLNEALFYRDYINKENLLFQCFVKVNEEIGSLYVEEEIPDVDSKEKIEAISKKLWMKYFRFLIENGTHTLFFIEFMTSPYTAMIKKEHKQIDDCFVNLAKIVEPIFKEYGKEDKVNDYVFWTYTFNTGLIFAKEILRGSLPNTEETYEQVWNVVHNGTGQFVNA